ncbi:MAG: PepSY-like domain-containing protein, partial [Bacteroidota bacterium]
FSIAEKVSWAVDDDDYKADFKVSKVDFTATFDKTGKWLMTEKFIKQSELPKLVRDSVTKEFGQLSGYTYEDIERVETEKNIVYEMDIKKGELSYIFIISEKGEILKVEQKPEKKEEDE